jgi:hypothetical protein
MDATEDKKERRRVMEAFNAKRKREKKKVEIDVLEGGVWSTCRGQ